MSKELYMIECERVAEAFWDGDMDLATARSRLAGAGCPYEDIQDEVLGTRCETCGGQYDPEQERDPETGGVQPWPEPGCCHMCVGIVNPAVKLGKGGRASQ